MTTLSIELTLDNASFREEDGGALNMGATSLTVLRVSHRIALGELAGPVWDANGNTIGQFKIEGEPRRPE